MLCRKSKQHHFNKHSPTMGLQMWSVPMTNLAWTLFFLNVKRRKSKRKKNAHKVALVAKAFKSKHDKFFESLNSENVQSALLTRAATCRKKLIEPIVILDVKHRKTLILKSLSGWPMLIYGMCLFRTYLETQELGQLLSSIRPTQILL